MRVRIAFSHHHGLDFEHSIEKVEPYAKRARTGAIMLAFMSLSPGTKLGPYEIQAPLGAGGMGEVYRARDTRLERIVAIKVLPSRLSFDPDLKQRLEREARAISSLNHPHICALYDIGTQEGIDFLVMEYLEGQTLADRLQKGALPIEQVLKTGIEIADALAKAHRQGIIHRDLKPGNIMLTKSGAKLMDFGLAKPAPAVLAANASGRAPTLSNQLTAKGTVVGTFQYMAPEQLEGKDADARSDIFAFGAVLYEMATGKPAFSGKTPASIVAAILASEPTPIKTLQPASPPELDRVINTALAKDPDERWQSAHDVSITLALTATSRGQPASKSRNVWRIVAGLLAVVAFAWASILIFSRPSPNTTLLRLAIPPPPNARFQSATLALSPEGRQVAFVATNSTGQQLLWIRALDSLESRALVGTDDADAPFWSPDSKTIGFFAHSKLKKVSVIGGQPEIICDSGADNGGGTWNKDGVIVFAPKFEGVLYRVAASGGKPTPVTEAYKTHEEGNHVWPQFLPDGRHFLFVVIARDDSGVHVGSLDSKEHHLILNAVSTLAYVEPGYLLFARNGVLMAQRFDAKQLRLLGEPVHVADGVEEIDPGAASFSASNNGVLVYWAGTPPSLTQLTWLRRDGTQIGTIGPVGRFRDPALSPDGRMVALERLESLGVFSVWLIDARGVPTRFTYGGYDFGPVWAPDGSAIMFSSAREGLPPNLFEKALRSGSEEKRLFRRAINSFATDWSRDGRYLVYSAEPSTSWDIWMIALTGDRTPKPLLQTEFNEVLARISPDGRWMAYQSDESGKWEVYVRPFLAEGQKWQVSTAGGFQPRWANDGTELFYLSADQKLMAVSVRNVPSFEPGTPKPLFPLHTVSGFLGFFLSSYEVSADRQRFLVNTLPGAEASPPLTVIINWTTALESN
jgi:eukaryotic-like serine/threonine-protein kinase